MKQKLIKIISAALAMMLAATPAFANTPQQPVEQTIKQAANPTAAITQGTFNDFFPDPEFAKFIANQLGKQANQQTTTQELGTITSLYSWYGKIKSFEGIEYLPNLTSIAMYYGELEIIPDSFTTLKKLTFFDIGANKVEKLPEEIGDMVQLTYLDVGTNKLTSLPASISKLKNLNLFALGGNQFTELPNIFDKEHFPNLKYLFLGGNNLTELPESLLQRALDHSLELSIERQKASFKKQNIKINQVLTLEDILPKIIIQSNNGMAFKYPYHYNHNMQNISGELIINKADNPDYFQNFNIQNLLDNKYDLSKIFQEPGEYKLAIKENGEVNANGTIHEMVVFDYEYTIIVEAEPETKHTVTVITRYLDDALPDETKTYTVEDGASFLEKFDMLDGYEVYNTALRAMPVFSVDSDAKTVSLSSVDKDYTIELEFDKIEYKVKVATEFPDGKHQNTSKTYWERHGDTSQQTIEIPDGYTITNLDQLPSDVQVDLINKTVMIPNIKKDYDIKLILEKQEYQVTIQIVYGDDETKNTTDTYTVAYGDSLTTPFKYDTENYRIKNITFDASAVSVNRTNQVITVDSVTGNINITISLK